MINTLLVYHALSSAFLSVLKVIPTRLAVKQMGFLRNFFSGIDLLHEDTKSFLP